MFYGFPPDPLSISVLGHGKVTICFNIFALHVACGNMQNFVNEVSHITHKQWKYGQLFELPTFSQRRLLPSEFRFIKVFWLFLSFFCKIVDFCAGLGTLSGFQKCRLVPAIWDKEKDAPKPEPSFNPSARIVTPCLPETTSGYHSGNQPCVCFYSAALTLLKSYLSPYSTGGLTISRHILFFAAQTCKDMG